MIRLAFPSRTFVPDSILINGQFFIHNIDNLWGDIPNVQMASVVTLHRCSRRRLFMAASETQTTTPRPFN